jgi:hypothetical protein
MNVNLKLIESVLRIKYSPSEAPIKNPVWYMPTNVALVDRGSHFCTTDVSDTYTVAEKLPSITCMIKMATYEFLKK